MTPALYDFRKPAPLPPAVRGLATTWLPKVCQVACRQVTAAMPFPVEMEPAGLEVLTAGQLLEQLPETSLRFRAAVSGAADASWLVLPRPVVLALLSGLLGETFDPAQPDRELTPLEEDVSDFVAREYFLGPLQEPWPHSPKLRLDAPARLVGPASAPYLPGTLLLVAGFRMRGPFGEQPWWWALPRAGWIESLGGSAQAPKPAPPTREEREQFARGLPLRLTVHLGTARMSLVHLAGLEVGDVLLLEQPIDQPLSASLGDQVKFLVWPGAVGARQAVAIHSHLSVEGETPPTPRKPNP
jgi:flagellar motor switch protein FliM